MNDVFNKLNEAKKLKKQASLITELKLGIANLEKEINRLRSQNNSPTTQTSTEQPNNNIHDTCAKQIAEKINNTLNLNLGQEPNLTEVISYLKELLETPPAYTPAPTQTENPTQCDNKNITCLEKIQQIDLTLVRESLKEHTYKIFENKHANIKFENYQQ